MRLEGRLLTDLAAFARLQLASGDIDPTYPVLRNLYAHLGLSRDAALWCTALYVAYYHLGSAVETFLAQPEPSLPRGALLHLPTGIERRGMRDRACLRAHLEGWVALTRGGVAAWLDAGLDADPLANFHRLWDRLLAVPFNGRWAAFKWCDLLLNVHAFPLAFPDMRLAECSGPRAGLLLLLGLPEASRPSVAALNRGAMMLRNALADLYDVALPWEQLETILCDFHGMAHGRYYPGHDIDEMQERIDRSALSPATRTALYAARAASFPAAYLGEVGGWHGVDKQRNTLYRRTGAIRGR